MKQKTLQEQYNLILKGKGNVEIFEKTAKKLFPSIIRNAADIKETINSLKRNNIIHSHENTKSEDSDFFSIFKSKLNEKEKKYSDFEDRKISAATSKSSIKEIEDVNDSPLMRARTSRDRFKNQVDGEPKYSKGFHVDKTQQGLERYELEDERAQITRDMEQEAEPQGGEVAGRFGDALNSIDDKLKRLRECGRTFVKEAKEAKGAKAEEKKTPKEVIDMEVKGYDYKDIKNIDNIFGQEFLSGYYCEMKDPKNSEKTVEQIKDIVAKNLTKDRLHYVKDGQFGVKGLGYRDDLPGLKASKTDQMVKVKLKEGVSNKQPLKAPYDNDNFNPPEADSREYTQDDFNEFPDDVWFGFDAGEGEDLKTRAINKARDISKSERVTQHVNRIDDGKGNIDYRVEDWYDSESTVASFEDGRQFSESKKNMKHIKLINLIKEQLPLGEKPSPKPKKEKKPTLDSKLSEIENQGKIATIEFQIEAISHAIDSKSKRLSMVSEDESLSELVDKKKIKEMEKEIKLLEKKKATMVKVYEKTAGCSYSPPTEIVSGDTIEDNNIEERKRPLKRKNSL